MKIGGNVTVFQWFFSRVSSVIVTVIYCISICVLKLEYFRKVLSNGIKKCNVREVGLLSVRRQCQINVGRVLFTA